MQTSFIILLGFLFYLLICASFILTADTYCSEAGNFTTNSTYGRNRDIILSSLASNVTLNDGFYNTTIGEGPNKVYGLVFCPDFTDMGCSGCVNPGVENIKEKCTNQKEALLGDGCIVRYSNRSFVGKLEMEPVRAGYNTGNITSNLTEFDQIWDGLMDRVATRASMSSFTLKAATEEANLTSFDKIYSLMQCTPDISQQNCDFCLRQSVTYYNRCCHGYRGGYVQRPNCLFRWDLYPFYEATANAPPPSTLTNTPPPSPPTGSNGPSVQSTKDNGGISSVTIIMIVVVSIVIFFAVIALACVLSRRKNLQQKITLQQELEDDDEIETEESLQFDFNEISAATDNFSSDKILGQGGFGIVYKGQLSNGQAVAVKRLSRNSGQGEREFKNEVLLVAKLQHRNLVRLLGFCLRGSERLLVYEFVPNSSLDSFIFDPKKHLILNWEMRYKIIGGIARGLLYLHEDSRLRIIHCDLKASNILLDRDMSPKISDFGLARLFDVDQSQGNTTNVAGTRGYMAPEYLINGQFSAKSDVFSFGVLVLEIISGQKNHRADKAENLLSYAWEMWRRGKALELIDPVLTVGSQSEMLRCIHIGLLCVQNNVADRPNMASVVLMLTSSSTSLAIPSKPAFLMHDTREFSGLESISLVPSKSSSAHFSINEVSITELDPR